MKLLRCVTTALAVVALVMPLAVTSTAAGGEEPARLLVVTVANGYVHEFTPVMEEVIEALGRDSGLYAVDFARTNEALKEKTTPEALAGYDGVVFANTSRDVPVADREAFVAWVEGGRAFVGIHGASTFEGWPELTALLGGQFDYHKEQATVKVRVDDPGHPATQGLESGFEVHEEMYLYKRFDRQRVHMLLSLDRHPNTREPGFFPWAWTRVQGEGRIFHTGAGHREDIVRSDWFARHVLGGIRWSLGS